MSVVPKRYCYDCHPIPVLNDATFIEKVKTKMQSLGYRLISHAYVSGKTFTAHPIAASLLLTTMVVATVVSAVLFTAGWITPGIALVMVAYVVAAIGFALFIVGRKGVDAFEHKKAHSFEKMQHFIKRDQKICLVLEAAFDNNGALRTKGPKDWERVYPAIHIKVSSIQDIQDAIQKVASVAKIQVLWLAAHGNSRSIRLGEKKDNVIKLDNLVLLSDALNQLEKDAAIVCFSCKTGKISKDDLNIANQLSKIARGRSVIAPTTLVSDENIYLKCGKNPKIRILKYTFGKIGALLDLMTPNFIGKYIRENVMSVYKDGVKQEATLSFQINLKG